MVLCPRCGSPKLVQNLEFSHPDGTLRAQSWTCVVDGCGWTGLRPNRVRGSLLVEARAKAVKVGRFTKAMFDLQSTGDLILVSGDTKEVVW